MTKKKKMDQNQQQVIQNTNAGQIVAVKLSPAEKAGLSTEGHRIRTTGQHDAVTSTSSTSGATSSSSSNAVVR